MKCGCLSFRAVLQGNAKPAYARLRLVLLLAFCWAAPAGAQQDLDEVVIELLPVRDNVYMLVGSGGNITVQAGEEGVLLVDSQYAPLSERILARIAELNPAAPRFLLNTHYHPDHTGGNANFAAAGAELVAHENLRLRLLDPPVGTRGPEAALPTRTYSGAYHDLHFNGEGIRLLHQPAAHTDGDSFVHFRRADVIATGDVYVTNMYPFIDSAAGGSIQGIITAANVLVDLMIPARGQDGGTLVIPGHGRLSDRGDVIAWRDMLTIIRDRIQAMLDRGMTLQEVQAARPTQDYDARWGRDSGFWTTTQFVETVYHDLAAAGGN